MAAAGLIETAAARKAVRLKLHETGEETSVTAMNREPYQQAYYPPRPTTLTRSMRKFLPWQLVRFLVINLKMIMLMRKSHG